MKKGYVYFLPPIIATAIFVAIYMGFNKDHKAKIEAFEQSKIKAAADKVAAQNKAIQDNLVAATKAVEERKQQKAAEDDRRQKEVEAIEAELLARTKARNDSADATQKATDLRKDVEALRRDIDELAANKKAAEAEQAHMRTLVKEAQDNVASYHAKLKEIEDTRAAWQKRMAQEAAKAQKQK